MADNIESEGLMPKSPWAEIRHVRVPWVREKHGKQVLPPNDQTSNQDLTNKQVLQPRVEPIGMMSTAKPLRV